MLMWLNRISTVELKLTTLQLSPICLFEFDTMTVITA